MIRLDFTVPGIAAQLTAGYTIVRIYSATTQGGAFTTLEGTVTLYAGKEEYTYVDQDGTTALWYKTALYGTTPGEAAKSTAVQGSEVAAYCTAGDVRRELGMGSGNQQIGAEHEDVLWDMAIEATRLIDRFKRVEPGAYSASGSETRYFPGSGMNYQRIDHAVSVSKVEVEETDGTYTEWTADTDYFTWPYNAAAIGESIRALEVSEKSPTTKSVFTAGRKRVKVTGVWGIASTPPDDIARACKIQTARWFKRAQQAWQDAGMSAAESGQMSYVKKLDPDVETLLKGAFPTVMAGI